MGPNFQNNNLVGGQPTPSPMPQQPTPGSQQPVMGVPQPIPDTQPQPVQPVQPAQPVMPQPAQPVQMGVPQPVQPEQPVQPGVPQPVEQPQPMPGAQPMPGVQPMQPEATVPDAQPMQPVPEQQPMPGMSPVSGLKSKKNLIIIGAIAGVVLIIFIVVMIVMLNAGNGSSEPGEEIPEPAANLMPTPELAESVCQERGGTFKSAEDYSLNLEQESNKYYSDMYGCEKYSDSSKMPSEEGDFAYEIYFVKEEMKDEYWGKVKESFSEEAEAANLAGEYTVLENSDEYVKGHIGAEYIAAYDNAMIMLSAIDVKTAEEILVELGFPDRNRADVEKEDEGEGEGESEGEGEGEKGEGEGESEEENAKITERDTQRRKDYNSLQTAVTKYASTADDGVAALIKNGDPATLKASKWINKSGKDPNEKEYDLKFYSYQKWQDAGSIAPTISETTNGSQVFVIIGANCGSTDANGNSLPQADSNNGSFAIYGHLESGKYLCLENTAAKTGKKSNKKE